MNELQKPAKSTTPSSVVRSLEQRRAANALAAVPRAEPDQSFKSKYRSYVEQIGPTILTNGLGQALATERAAVGEGSLKPEQRAHERLYNNLHNWLCGDSQVYPGSGDLLKAIVEHGETEYLNAQVEALAWLDWHKKFCRAYLPAPDKEKPVGAPSL